MTARETRQTAWNALVPQWKKVVGLSLFVAVIVLLVEAGVQALVLSENIFFSFILYTVCILALMPFYYSIYWVSMRLLRTGEIDLREMLEPYYSLNTFFKVLGTGIISSIFIALWTLLFIIPGIIKSFSYALIPFILKDKPELSIFETITLSRKMMDGYKLKYFYLVLTFIGWGILVGLTFGLLALWVTPYLYTSYAAFYEEVKEDYEVKNTIF